jgi:hypothetical protein
MSEPDRNDPTVYLSIAARAAHARARGFPAEVPYTFAHGVGVDDVVGEDLPPVEQIDDEGRLIALPPPPASQFRWDRLGKLLAVLTGLVIWGFLLGEAMIWVAETDRITKVPRSTGWLAAFYTASFGIGVVLLKFFESCWTLAKLAARRAVRWLTEAKVS